MARAEKIISLVSEYGKIEVTKLAHLIGVSNITIRKDLDKLEDKGIVNRQHGYALINSNSTDNINFRLSQNHETKQRIAQKAAESISDGESVMIESGSTCALLAEELANSNKNVTIITNSTFLPNFIRQASNVKIILIGGEYQSNSQVNVGPLVKKVVEEFYVDKLFIGIDGFDCERGFRCNDISRCATTQVMATSCDQVIALTDSSKFCQNATVTCFATNQISKVYTDTDLKDEMKEFLLENHVDVVTV